MYTQYLERLRAAGRRHFTIQEVMQELNLSKDGAKSGVYRLRKTGKVISPIKGFYVIVPPEHYPQGCIPAEELVPIMMSHLGTEYYVGLLSAAAFYGATHQKIFRFQIVTNARITHPLQFGQIKIDVIKKKSLIDLPTRNFVVSTGYLKVATPELVAIDLFKYLKHAGGISHIATVLAELTDSINANNLIELAKSINEQYQLQRLGYMIERIEVMDENKKNEIISSLEKYLKGNMKSYVPLASNIKKTGYPKCRKWKIIENTDFESDL